VLRIDLSPTEKDGFEVARGKGKVREGYLGGEGREREREREKEREDELEGNRSAWRGEKVSVKLPRGGRSRLRRVARVTKRHPSEQDRGDPSLGYEPIGREGTSLFSSCDFDV